MKALLVALFLIVCLMAKTIDANHDYIYTSGIGGYGGWGGFYPRSTIIRRTIYRTPLYGSSIYPGWGRASYAWKHNEGESQESDQ